MKNIRILNGFWIRIIAIITMVIDHFVLLLASFELINTTTFLYTFLRIIGRISFPLFALGIVEGVLHTKNLKKYLLRLAIMALTIIVGYLFLKYVLEFAITIGIDGNIFITLLLGAISIALFEKKNKLSLLGVIPIFYSILIYFNILPNIIMPEYGLYGVLMIVGIYGGYLIAEKYSIAQAEKYHLDYSSYQLTTYYQKSINMFYALMIVMINLLFYILIKFVPEINQYTIIQIQDFSIISTIFVILYNGKRGYDKKWFRVFNYVFYPTHLLLLYGIAYLFL